MLIAALTDFAIAYVVALFFATDGFSALGLAFVIYLGAEIFLALYGLIRLARGALVFYMSGRKTGVASTVDAMIAAKMPQPDRFYGYPNDYLMDVCNSDDVPKEARNFAAATVGNIDALRSTGHSFMVMCSYIVLEEAIGQYRGRLVGRPE